MKLPMDRPDQSLLDGVPPAPGNLMHADAAPASEEQFDELLRRPDLHIERIVSRGHVTPPDRPFLQDRDEWVLVLRGSARLTLEGVGDRTLDAGEYLLIPAGVPHRVTYTADPTIWLAVHFGGA